MYTRGLVHVPAAPLPFQLPAYGTVKQERMGQSLGNLHPSGRPKVAPGFTSPVSAVVAKWGVKQQIKDLSIFPALRKSAFPIKINKSLINK